MIGRQIPAEVLLTSAYAVFLLAVAFLLEQLAKHSRKRTEQYELAGFRYHSGFDHWECPTGTHLVRVESDPVRQVARYRAPASHCNTCGCKKNCTDSDTGREIEHHLDLWLQSGLHEFHRGISFALLILAALLLIVEIVRHSRMPAVLLPGVLLLIIGFSAARLLASHHTTQSHLSGQSLTMGAARGLRWPEHR